MDVSPDYEDLFKSLNAHKVKYLVVGAQAVIFHTEPRWTKDSEGFNTLVSGEVLSDPEVSTTGSFPCPDIFTWALT